MEGEMYRTILSYRNYIAVHREFIKKLGPAKAILLTELIKKEDDIVYQGMLEEDGSFYFLLSDIQETTGFSYEQISTYTHSLMNTGLLSIKRRGQPHRNYYKINYKEVEKILTSEKPRGKTPESSNSGKSEIGNEGNSQYRKIAIYEKEKLVLNNNSQYNNSQLATISSIQDATHSSKEGSEEPLKASEETYQQEIKSPGKKQMLKDDIKQLLLEILPLGEFTNRPPQDDKPVAKLYLDVQRFLTLLPDPEALSHAYVFDKEWLEKEKIDLEFFRGRAIEPLVRRAVKRFAMMRKVGYAPEKKGILTKYVQDFFYNPSQKKSWFLYCCFHEPVEVSHKPIFDISDEEKDILLKHKRPDWSEKDYLVKAVKLLKWYKKNYEGLELYNYYVMDSMTFWQTKFSDIDSFLSVIDEYSKTWKEWTIGNFGVNNGTWDYFVKWCRDTFQVELDVSVAEVEGARKIKNREDKKTKSFVENRKSEDEEVEARRNQIKAELLAELGEACV